MASMMRSGFTLIELLLAVFLSAALLILSSLSWREHVDGNTLRRALDSLRASVLFARNYALSKARTVSLCASPDGLRCGGLAYERGWIVFVEDNDAEIAQRSSDEPVLELQPALSNRLSIRPSASLAPALTFSSRGRLAAGGRIVFCLDNDSTQARALVLIRSGRMRVADAREARSCSA